MGIIDKYNKEIDKIIAKKLSVQDVLIEVLKVANKYEISRQLQRKEKN